MAYYTEEQKKQIKEQGEKLKEAVTGFAEVVGEATASTLRNAVRRLRISLEQVEKDLAPAADAEERMDQERKQ